MFILYIVLWLLSQGPHKAKRRSMANAGHWFVWRVWSLQTLFMAMVVFHSQLFFAKTGLNYLTQHLTSCTTLTWGILSENLWWRLCWLLVTCLVFGPSKSFLIVHWVADTHWAQQNQRQTNLKHCTGGDQSHRHQHWNTTSRVGVSFLHIPTRSQILRGTALRELPLEAINRFKLAICSRSLWGTRAKQRDPNFLLLISMCKCSKRLLLITDHSVARAG